MNVNTSPKKSTTPHLMTGAWLILIRRKALRRNVWFSTLSKLERSIVNLTIRCVDKIKSANLALAIGRIVCRVSKAFKSIFLKRVEKVGTDLAEKLVEIAVSWGYLDASNWRTDSSFIRCLGVNALNNNVSSHPIRGY